MVKKLIFWQKFLRFAAVGLSAMVMLYFVQVQPTAIFAQTTLQACPNEMVSNLTPNGTTLPAGTTSYTLSWTGAPNASSYSVLVQYNNGQSTVYSNTVTSPSASVTGLQNGFNYTWSVVPYFNSCGGYGNTSNASFSVAAGSGPVGNCSNPPVWCGPAEDRELIYPDPNNNCQYPHCFGPTYPYNPGGSVPGYAYPYPSPNFYPTPSSSPNAPTCAITTNPSPPSGPSPLFVNFLANSSSPLGRSLSWSWDLNGDGAFDDKLGISATATYYNSTNVRLLVSDSAGLTNSCSVFVNVTNQAFYPTPNYTYPTPAYTYPTPANFCQMNCNPAPGCVFIGTDFTTCSCGTLVCSTPSLPANLPSGLPLGNFQETLVNVANANANTNFSNNFSSSSSSSSTGGGSANVSIK